MSTSFHTLIGLDGVRVLSQSIEFSAKWSSPGPPCLSPMEVRRVEGRLVWIGPEGPTEDSGGGDLVRTWCRLMCHALAEVVSLILE